MSEWSYIARLPGYDATTCIHCWYRVIDGRLEVHEYKGNLGLNETSHVGAPIGDPIELQPGEDAHELAWSLLKAHHKAKPHEDPYRNKPLPWNPAVVPW